MAGNGGDGGRKFKALRQTQLKSNPIGKAEIGFFDVGPKGLSFGMDPHLGLKNQV